MKSVKILLVEDNQNDVFLAKRALSKMNLNDVDIVSDGKEALEYLFGDDSGIHCDSLLNRPDLILLDQRMPRLDGMKFMECAHSSLHNHNVPVIVITSSILDLEKERFIELGAKDYIGKPVNVEGLNRAIMKAMPKK